MRASMSQAQNLPQHRTIVGISSGGSFHNSTAAVPSQSRSSIASFENSLGGAEYRNSEVQPLETSSSRWKVLGSDSDMHISTRWPNNSNETSGHGSPALDTVSAAYSELFDSSIRGTDGQQQQFMDSSGRFSGSVASMLPGDSPGFGHTASSPLGGALVSGSPRLCQGWKSTVDHGNLGLTVDPSKGGLSLQGVLGGRTTNTQSLPRFSPSPGFAERAARFSAFGNGPYSAPSFPLTENGNVGRSPSFENDCNKRAKASVSASRSEVGLEISGRSSVLHSNALEGKGGQRGREHGNGRGGAKASGGKASATPGCSQVDQDDVDEGLLPEEEEERASWDSEASDVCRGQQETSCADQVAVGHFTRSASNIGKKRKNTADALDKEASSPSLKELKGSGGQQKRCKDGEAVVEKEEQKTKPEWSGSENSGLPSPGRKDGSKTAEQPKLDYIHVRARRGQATDSHSLAERVRREKISERMKYLQDLVPGCSKVTGKAVMLDEIINYVQSIQRQVEFLSMKLAAVTPRADFNIDSILSKQLQIGNGYGDPNVGEHTDTVLPFSHMQSQQPVRMPHGVTHNVDFQPPVDMNLRRMSGSPMPLPRTPIDAFDIGPSQCGVQAANIWDGDLQSVVQMGFGQGMQGFGLSGLQCDLPPGHMKMEL